MLQSRLHLPFFASIVLLFFPQIKALAQEVASHPPARPLPAGVVRPLSASGPTYFVNATDGDDSFAGTEQAPWKTLTHAVVQLKAGDQLVLRGGVFHEQVAVRSRGTAGKPVTIRSYPGEVAIIDGGLADFYQAPEAAWEPFDGGADGEFRSVKSYPDLGDKDGSVWLLGRFGDSMTPLHGYRAATDLRSDNEYFAGMTASKFDEANQIYSGPGVWYDVASGRIHIRLAHTSQLCLGDHNYRGETDPRKLRLVIAGGRTSPLHLDTASHIVLQDLVVRGARQAAIDVTNCSNITLDGVTAYGGASALRVESSSGLRCLNSAFRGIAAPWTWRGSLKYRAIEARIVSASSWNPPARPNRDFEFAYCEFTDCVDGVFIGNVEDVKIHHCLLDHISDDGIFVTSRAGYDGLTHGGDIHIYQNILARCLSTFAFGVGHGRQRTIEDPATKQLGEPIWIHRNLFDFRLPVHYQQPGKDGAEILTYGRVSGDHGSPAWEPMYFYHNTFLQATAPWRNYYAAGLAKAMGKGTTRRILNNVFYHFHGRPGDLLPDPAVDFVADSNRHWSADLGENKDGEAARSDDFLKKNSTPWAAKDRYQDPEFASISQDSSVTLDLTSPHRNDGAKIPSEWPDPLRTEDSGAPDIGLMPGGLNGDAWRVGVRGRLNAFRNQRPDLSLAETTDALSEFQHAAAELPTRRVAMVVGYPAFSAPLTEFAFEKAGFAVDVYEKTWLPVADYASYDVVVFTGDLQRAKMQPFCYVEADYGALGDYLKQGGKLVMMRGNAAQAFAGDQGKKYLASLIGEGPRVKDYSGKILTPGHPWIRHLDSEGEYPWMASKNITPLTMTRGENLVGDAPTGTSQLGRVAIGDVGGELIHIGWIIGQSIPPGRKASSIADEIAYEEQYKILEAMAREWAASR